MNHGAPVLTRRACDTAARRSGERDARNRIVSPAHPPLGIALSDALGLPRSEWPRLAQRLAGLPRLRARMWRGYFGGAGLTVLGQQGRA